LLRQEHVLVRRAKRSGPFLEDVAQKQALFLQNQHKSLTLDLQALLDTFGRQAVSLRLEPQRAPREILASKKSSPFYESRSRSWLLGQQTPYSLGPKASVAARRG